MNDRRGQERKGGQCVCVDCVCGVSETGLVTMTTSRLTSSQLMRSSRYVTDARYSFISRSTCSAVVTIACTAARSQRCCCCHLPSNFGSRRILPTLHNSERKCAEIQLAQCQFPGLAISNAKILTYFSDEIYGSNFIKRHSETVMV